MNRIVKALIISLVISGFLVSGGFLLVKKIRENNDLHSLLKNKPAFMYTVQGMLRLTDNNNGHSSPTLEALQKRLSPLCGHLQLQKTSDGVYTLTADGIRDTALLITLLNAHSTLQWWPMYNLIEFAPFLLRADSLLRLSSEKKETAHSDTGTAASTATTVEELLAKKEKGKAVTTDNDEDLEHPIFSLLHIGVLSKENNLGDHSEVGYITKTDTEALSQYLKMPLVKGCLPADAELMYGTPYWPDDEPSRYFYLYAIKKNESRPMLDESFLIDASLTAERRYGQRVTLRFNQLGASRLERLTMANIGRNIAMVANNKVLVAAKVEDAISGGDMVFTANEKYARMVYLLVKYPLSTSVGIDRLTFAVQPPPSPFKPIWLLIGLAVWGLIFLLTLSIDKAFKNMATGKRQ